MANAKDFYGSAYTPERAAKLDSAFKFLEMAIRAEADQNNTKIDMAMNAALKNEREAFSS